MDLGLAGKVALITGGSDGIGKATALELAAEGARVAICARRPEVLDQAVAEIHQATGVEVLAVSADVSKAAEIERCVGIVAEKLGPITLLVNNAGTLAQGSVESVTDEAWYADIDLKLLAAVRTSRLVIPGMRAAGGGRIVNVTAISGKQPGANSLPTSVSRAAGIALTKAMSKELAKDNILVNTVCIGIVKSGQTGRTTMRLQPGAADLEAAYARRGAEMPLGRLGEASEVSGLIALLLSERGSYLTGVAINVDGGASGVV